MTNDNWDEFWWNRITGPNYVTSLVADVLIEKNNVMLQIPFDLPWRYKMRQAVEDTYRQKSDSDIIIDSIDAQDECDMPPGKFLLERYATGKIKNAFRESSGQRIQDYLIQNEVLRNRIIWIKGLTNEHTKEWIDFCRYYVPKDIGKGLFVLEIRGNFAGSGYKAIKKINFSDNVSAYDLQMFNSFVLSSMTRYNDIQKKYVAAVCASLCRTDAEVSEALIETADFFNEDPLEGIRRIAEMPEFERRGADKGSSHVLACLRYNKTAELEYRIWSAQLQVLFPLIEMERINIIKKYKNEIQNTLDAYSITAFGKRITSALDIELGNLHRITAQKDGLEYLLYIPQDEDRNRIILLHECRNLLAHINCCSPKQVKELVTKTVIPE